MMGPLPITDPGHVRCDQSISDLNFNKNEHPSHYLSYHHLHSTDSLKAVTFIGMFPGLGSNMENRAAILQMNQTSLKNNVLKFKSSGKLPIFNFCRNLWNLPHVNNGNARDHIM